MTTALFTHADCLAHLTPDGHPERVARLTTALAALAGYNDLMRCDAPLAGDADLLRAHSAAHLSGLKAAEPATGQTALDADTWLSPGSVAAALRAAGAGVAAVDLVMAGGAQNAFCAVRPPGHHAERDRAMGFCLLGSVAVAALHAVYHHGLARVAVVDFDVHHGNGTQDILWNEPAVLFVSTHQSPLYPGTGAVGERGAQGNILNVPLREGTAGAAFRAIVTARVLPVLEAFAPELILISAGFDAHRADPLAGLMLEAADFTWITHRLCDIADRHAQGRVVSTLEGGYDLDALAACVAAHVGVLRERGA